MAITVALAGSSEKIQFGLSEVEEGLRQSSRIFRCSTPMMPIESVVPSLRIVQEREGLNDRCIGTRGFT